MRACSARRAAVTLVAALIAGAPAGARAVEAVFTIEAVVGGQASGFHHFGFATDALTGLDPRDLPEPPHAPSEYLALSFRMLDPSAPLPNRWRNDLRAADDFVDQVEIWELHLETDRLGQVCVFTVTPPADPPADLRLRVLGVGDGEGFEVPADGVFTVPVAAPDTAIWLELTSDEPIRATPSTWGGVRRLYGD